MNNRIYKSEVFDKAKNSLLKKYEKFCPKCFSNECEPNTYWIEETGTIEFDYTCLNCKHKDKNSEFFNLESMRNKKINQILNEKYT